MALQTRIQQLHNRYLRVGSKKVASVRRFSVKAHAKNVADTVPVVSEEPLLCYNWMCPFVHRLTLCLSHKKVDMPRVDIELSANKPSWFLDVSPYGKVPAITYMEGERPVALYESMVLMQWIEDYFAQQGPSLLPFSPGVTAKARIIMTRYDMGAVPLFYKMVACSDLAEFKKHVQALRTEFSWLEENMDPDGPFMLGAQPSMVDACVAPWLLRLFVLKALRNVDVLEGFPKIQRWLQAYSAHPEAVATIQPPPGMDWNEGMVDAYLTYYSRSFKDMSAAMSA